MSRDGAILILKTGEPPAEVKAAHGDFDLWIARVLRREQAEIEVAAVYAGDSLPEPESVAGVVVTGSPAMVTARPDWSEASAKWLGRVVDGDRVPVLGLCYGHQLIAHGLGGEVGLNPRGREIGTVEVTVHEGASEASGALFPEGRFPAHMSHSESVLVPPSDARIWGTTALESHAVLQFGPRQWGVQFHPEFDREIMGAYVEARRKILCREGLNPDEIIKKSAETPGLTQVLEGFDDLVRGA